MKSTTIIGVSIMGMLMLSPILASAEETSVSGSAGAETSVATPPASPATVDSYSFGESHPQMPPGKGGSGMVAPTKPLPIRESPTIQKVLAPRDTASGQSTGRRMMATDTRPLPPKMDDRMEKRDQMMGSGTKPMPAGIEMRNKMTASGTKPLPPGMEKRDHMMSSGTPMNGERREEMKERMQERRGEVLKRMSTQMITRMEAAIDRFVKLADRLDSRVGKLKEKGVNTATAEANLAIARTKITEATTAVALAKSSIESAVASADASGEDAGKGVREALQNARQAIEAAHKALVIAVSSLKAGAKVEVGATTSVAQ